MQIYTGRCYTQTGIYITANELFNNALKVLDNNYSEKNSTKALHIKALLFNYRGLLNKRLENYKTSLEYHLKELEIYKQLRDSIHIGNSYADIGRAYRFLGDYEKSLKYTIDAYNVVKKYGDTKILANTYKKLGLIYSEISDYKNALAYFQKAKILYIKFNDKQGLAVSYNSIGRIYCELNRIELGISFFYNALEIVKNSNDMENLFLSYKYLSEAYKSLNNYPKAYQYITLYYKYKDSIYKIEKERLIQDTEKKYNSKEQQHNIQDLKNKNQSYYMYFAMFGFLITLLIVVFVYYRYKTKISLNIILQEKNSELESLYSAVVIAKQKAEELVNTKENILRNLSHELQTPFNIIFGYLSLLKNEIETLESPKSIEYIELIQNHLNYLFNLLNDIYQISRIENGDNSLSYNTFILNDIIHSVYSKYKPQIIQKGINFEIFELGDIELTSEPNITKRIMEHLIDNAVKYTDQGKITVTLDYKDTKSNTIQVSIEDTGIGIDSDYLEKVFELFSQEEMEITRSYEGIGLGLFITKKFINILSGEIKIQSNKLIGTKIIVYLNSVIECNSVK